MLIKNPLLCVFRVNHAGGPFSTFDVYYVRKYEVTVDRADGTTKRTFKPLSEVLHSDIIRRA